MARIFPAVYPAERSDAAVVSVERQLFDRLARDLDAGWQIIHDCELRAGDEVGSVPFVLLHRDFGIALLGVAEPDEPADPQLAITAMRTMLGELEFTRRYAGHIAVVADAVDSAAPGNLAPLVTGLFAAAPASTISDPTWPDWLLQRLLPGTAAPEEPPASAQPTLPRRDELRAPEREESWRVTKLPAGEAAPAPAVKVTPERVLRSEDLERRSPLWTGMALAALVIVLVLFGMAMLSHAKS